MTVVWAFWLLFECVLLSLLGIDLLRWSGQLPVGCAFFAFEVDANVIAGLYYLHDYDLVCLLFCYSSFGFYGG